MTLITSVAMDVKEPSRVRIRHDREEWIVRLGEAIKGSRARVHRFEEVGPYVYTVGSGEWADRAQVHELDVLEWADVEREDVKSGELDDRIAVREADGWSLVFQWPTNSGGVHLVFQRELKVPDGDLSGSN